MAIYQPFSDFTAQSKTVAALMFLYAQLEGTTAARPNVAPIVVFLAFSIESYLNSLGARKLQIWDDLERLPWRKKMNILHRTANVTPDWSKDPLQFATEIFALRDKLAHGKPERVVGPIFKTHAEAEQYFSTRELQPEWYSKITREWVLRGKERFRLLMIYLGSMFGLHESDHLLHAMGGVLSDDERDA